MTNATPGAVEVTQADRDAAGTILPNIYGAIYNTSMGASCLTGAYDGGYLVQAFARHRIEATPPVQSELAEVVAQADMISSTTDDEDREVVLTYADNNAGLASFETLMKVRALLKGQDHG